MKKIIFIFVAAILISGCAQQSSVPLNKKAPVSMRKYNTYGK